MPRESAERELSRLREENARLRAVQAVLMDRVERTSVDAGSALGLFEMTSALLDEVEAERCRRRDASDRAERERGVAESAIREVGALRSLLDEHAVLSVTDRFGRLVDVNRGFCRISGYSREELIGRDHRIVNSGYHPKSFWAELWRTIASGRPWRGEVCNRRKDGELYWVDSTIVPHAGADGKPDGFVSLRFDVTDRKQAESELRALSERFCLFVEHTPMAVAMFDRDRRCLAASRGWHAAHGTDAASVDDGGGFDLFPSSPGRWARLFDRVLDGESLSVEREQHKDESGGEAWMRWQARPWHEEWGEVGGVIVLTEEIGGQVQHERRLRAAKREAEAANLAKSEFLANMSHEIRTPMTAILGFTDLLQERVDHGAPCVSRDAVQTIRRNAQHLLGVINDILDLSKIEAGELRVEQTPCSPEAIVSDIESLMRPRAAERGLDLSVRYETEMPESIRSDAGRLRQILINLMGNAVKFTESGGVRLTVRLRPGADDDPRLEFDIEDTGIGLTARQRCRLFRPFTQGDPSMSRRFGGSGLGLSISRRLARLLGGDVTLVRSEPSVGSLFRASVAPGPLGGVRMREVGPAPACRAVSEPAAGDRRVLAGGRILLAEDGPDNQRLFAHLLTKAGAEVTVVAHGGDAVEAMRTTPAESAFDLVLMDMQMPEVDGYEGTRRLRRLGFSGPIVALTAHAMAGDRERCLAAGCDDYLTKPIGREALIEACSSWLGAGHRADAPGAERRGHHVS